MKKRLLGIVIVMILVVTMWPTASFAVESENQEQYKPEMRVYAIYIHRAGGSKVSSDRYGEAVLIRSNGKYLLMDVGAEAPLRYSKERIKSSVTKALKKIGVKELDVYISHLHGDHQGGLQDVCNEFKVNKIYLPDRELCKNYYTPDTKKPISKIYDDQWEIASKEGAKIVYLAPSYRSHRAKTCYSTFSVGSVDFKVIGPTRGYTVSQFAYQDGKKGSKEGHYLNNCSLSVIAKCGNFKYLSMGDIETIEEKSLVNRYGSDLNCNLMKVSHHGLETSNSSSILKKATPMWSFTTNHGYYDDLTVSRARDYGYNYVVASSRHTMIYDIKDGAMRMFIDYNDNQRADDGLIKGWLKSKNRYQYYDSSGYIRTGWRWMNYNTYYLSVVSGFRFTGSTKVNGKSYKFTSDGKLTSHKRPDKGIISAVKKAGTAKLKITWKKSTRSTAYQVYRATSKNGTYRRIATCSSKTRTYTDKSIKSNKRYYYRVRGIRKFQTIYMYGRFSDKKSAVSR